jgi:transposase
LINDEIEYPSAGNPSEASFPHTDVVNFRRGHRGHSSVIEHKLGHDPFSGTLYSFANRQRNKMKYLFWEENGFVLYYKAIAKERTHLPQGKTALITLNGEQLNWLLDGYNVALMKLHRRLPYEFVA